MDSDMGQLARLGAWQNLVRAAWHNLVRACPCAKLDGERGVERGIKPQNWMTNTGERVQGWFAHLLRVAETAVQAAGEIVPLCSEIVAGGDGRPKGAPDGRTREGATDESPNS